MNKIREFPRTILIVFGLCIALAIWHPVILHTNPILNIFMYGMAMFTTLGATFVVSKSMREFLPSHRQLEGIFVVCVTILILDLIQIFIHGFTSNILVFMINTEICGFWLIFISVTLLNYFKPILVTE